MQLSYHSWGSNYCNSVCIYSDLGCVTLEVLVNLSRSLDSVRDVLWSVVISTPTKLLGAVVTLMPEVMPSLTMLLALV